MRVARARHVEAVDRYIHRVQLRPDRTCPACGRAIARVVVQHPRDVGEVRAKLRAAGCCDCHVS